MEGVDGSTPHEEGTQGQHNPALTLTYLMTKAKDRTTSPHSNLAAQCLQDLMDRHGVPRHKQAGVVASVLNLSRSHGNRKLRGGFPMTLDEIAQVAEHFGETLLQALEPCLSQGMQPALLMTGELETPCEVLLGELLRPPFDEKLVAIGAPGNLLVVPAHGVSLPARQIKRLVLRLNQHSKALDRKD